MNCSRFLGRASSGDRLKLGGFVIHGSHAATLGAALDSLLAVSDVVAAVDSGSNDGAADLVQARGVRRVELPWRGYGAARARAAEALADCDYLFFLDADERLDEENISKLRAWKSATSTQGARTYTLRCRDWAELDGRCFLFREGPRRRLFRRDTATWKPEMIVHESVGKVETVPLDIAFDHRFAVTLEDRAFRNDRYALLWAIQASAEGRGMKPVSVQRVSHYLKDAVLSGALFRAGTDASRLAWLVSRYHAQKYEYLRRIRQGEFAELVSLYRDGALRELFVAVEALEAALPAKR